MSAVIVLAPLVAANWATIGAIVVGAMGAMGFTASQNAEKAVEEAEQKCAGLQNRTLTLAVERSEIVTDSMALDESMVFQRGDVTIEFFRDARGSCSVRVFGASSTEEELRELGESATQRIVQHYVYQRLAKELKDKDYQVLEQTEEADSTIKLRVRRLH